MKKGWIVISILLALLVTSVGCQQQGQQDDVIKFGLSVPLSGGAAAWGNSAVRATELVFEGVNAQGGVDIKGKKYKLQVVAYDSKYQLPEVFATVEKLITLDKVKYVSVMGAGADAVAKRLDQAGILHFALATGPRTVSPDLPLQYSLFAGPTQLYDIYNYWKEKRPELKKLAVLVYDDANGFFRAQMATQIAKKAGFTVVNSQFVAAGTKEFSPYLLNIMKDSPDVIEIGGIPPGDAGLLIKQARDLGYKGVVDNGGAAETAQVVSVAGKEYAEGYSTGGAVEGKLPQGMQEVKDKYLAKYGEPYLATVSFHTQMGAAFVAGLKGAQSTEPKDIAAWLSAGNEFDTVVGKAHFWGKETLGISNQIVTPFPILQVKNGVGEVLYWSQPPAGN